MLLADEPTGNLDRVTGEEVVRLLEALNVQGMTLIVVTHDQALGARARRQIRMDDGGIVSDVTQPPEVATPCIVDPNITVTNLAPPDLASPDLAT